MLPRYPRPLWPRGSRRGRTRGYSLRRTVGDLITGRLALGHRPPPSSTPRSRLGAGIYRDRAAVGHHQRIVHRGRVARRGQRSGTAGRCFLCLQRGPGFNAGVQPVSDVGFLTFFSKKMVRLPLPIGGRGRDALGWDPSPAGCLEGARAARVKGQDSSQLPLPCPPRTSPCLGGGWEPPSPVCRRLEAGTVCFGRRQALSAEPPASFPQPTL